MIPIEDEQRLEQLLKDIHAVKSYQEKAEMLYTALQREYERGYDDGRRSNQPELDLDEGMYAEGGE